MIGSKISDNCKTTDEITPNTCIGTVYGTTMIISMFGNGTAHYDRYHGNLVKKPDEIASFAVFSRSSIRGTLFCKQSEHKHVAPDLEIPALKSENAVAIEISEIKSFNFGLDLFPPVSASLNVMQSDLLKASKAIDESENAMRNIRHNTSSAIGHFKTHFENAVSTVESKLNSVYMSIITKVILPILLPPICIAGLAFLLWNHIKNCCRKNPDSNGSKMSRSFVLSEHDSRKEEIDLTNHQEIKLLPKSS